MKTLLKTAKVTPADPDEVDPDELDRGTQVELEHTDDEDEARRIALEHLAEDPQYYSKLDQAGL